MSEIDDHETHEGAKITDFAGIWGSENKDLQEKVRSEWCDRDPSVDKGGST
jgi:hypothetical protein